MSGNLYHQRFKTPQQRFLEFVGERRVGCWEWTGKRDRRGEPFKPYGSFWLDGKTVHAHRAAWLLFRGPIPEGLHVLHRCDNPPCVNWEECLFLGTPKDNTADMIAKGRAHEPIRGERHPWCRLTEVQVRAIYHDDRVQHVIARDFGVTQTAVSQIKLRKRWAHVAV